MRARDSDHGRVRSSSAILCQCTKLHRATRPRSVRSGHLDAGIELGNAPAALSGAGIVSTAGDYGHECGGWRRQSCGTGGKRRVYRSHSLEEKRRIVLECLTSGDSVSIVARRHDMNANQLFHWRKQYDTRAARAGDGAERAAALRGASGGVGSSRRGQRRELWGRWLRRAGSRSSARARIALGSTGAWIEQRS